ncbi:hypothetical protein KW782_00930 [Candidatus Parcubacteria bacterium]|nr:hypothetical protein [Candidatus Parcubacteria bacterium]
METLIHADIFFFITTIAVVLISIGIIVAIVYIIKILRTVSHVSDKVKEESEEILLDLKHLRGNVKSQGFRWSYVKQFIRSIFKRK